jgi:hypothetical protein
MVEDGCATYLNNDDCVFRELYLLYAHTDEIAKNPAAGMPFTSKEVHELTT